MNMQLFLFLSLLCSANLALATFVIDATPFNYSGEYWRSIIEQVKVADSAHTSFDLGAFVNSSGFPLEEHYVITDDKYQLALHRIPHGRTEDDDGPKPVVLFMHGILCSAAEFLRIGPDRSLAMQLADLGYDVWLGNNRGNTYSRDNLDMDPDDNEAFWDYSFQDMAVGDLPKIIDYILETTNNTELSYVGFSQGTTQVFALLSEMPEYNEKITLVTALAPVVYMKHLPSPIARIAAENLYLLEYLAKNLKLVEIFGHSNLLSALLTIICSTSIGHNICPMLFYILIGFDPDQCDKNYLPKFFETFPAGTSTKSLEHYGQEIKSGHFRKFDYGIIGNMQRYQQRYPPDYNLSNINTPVALFYGENDWFAAVQDVEQLATELEETTTVYKRKINSKFFNHMDFLYAKDMYSLVNYDVTNLINEHNNKDDIATSTTTEATTTHSTPSTTPSSGIGLSFNVFYLLPVVLLTLKSVLKIII